jgi:hypothetical protein
MARVLRRLTDAQPRVPAFVPANALVARDRGLEAVEQLVGSRAGHASLQIDDRHGMAVR